MKKLSLIRICLYAILFLTIFKMIEINEKAKEQPKQPNPYFWYEIGIIKANEQISKSKYLTEYEKRKIWLQIDSARKADSINISK